jgi:peptide/nickel transport system substrate-binding protein
MSLSSARVSSQFRRLRLLGAALGLAGTTLLGAGSISFYEESLPTTLNPLFSNSMVDKRSQELVFDRLFYRSAITNELKSRLVVKYEAVEGGKKLKIYLKPGVKWHDGKDFGPDDVCFTIDAMLNPSTPSQMAKEYRDTISACESLPKEMAAVVTFTKIYHNPTERIAFPVLPAHPFSGNTIITPDLDFSSRPIGTGPMTASKGRREVKFTAFQNPHHAPQIETASLAEGGDPFVQVRTLTNAGVQGVISVAPALRPDVAAKDDVALKSYDLRSWWFMALNTKSKFLAKKEVRQALNYTIDRNSLRELTIGVDPNDPNPPCEFISGPFVQSSPYYNRSVKINERSDKAKAGELMRAAGATESTGRWLIGGEPVTLKIGMNAPLDTEAKDLLNQIGNQLQAGGFDRVVSKVTADDWAAKAVTGQLGASYDILIGKWSFGVVEDVNAMFNSRKSGKGEKNIFGYSNAEVDAILARYEVAKTDTEAQDAYHDLHAYLAGDLPYIFLWKLDTKSAWRNEVKNNTITPYYYFTEFDGWKL